MKMKKKGPKKIKPLLFFGTLSLIAIFSLAMYGSFIFYGFLVVVSCALQFFMYTKELKINLGHVFFISVLIAQENLAFSLIFLFVAGFMAELLAGYLEAKTLAAYPIYSLFIIISALFKGITITLVGIPLSIACYFSLYIVATFLSEPLPEKILEIIVPSILNIVYFISFAEPLLSLIRFLT